MIKQLLLTRIVVDRRDYRCKNQKINQWENELKSKVKERVLEVIKYYGSNRESSARILGKKIKL